MSRTGFFLPGQCYKETTQQAVTVPVFPTDAATAKISGTLQAQLDMTTSDPEVVQNGIVSLNFNNVWDILHNPNSTGLSPYFGLVGVVFDGGFMQTVKTGADGKYEFKIPKTKNEIPYQLAVSTIQKEQKLLFGDYPYKLDSIRRVDTMKTWFGYYAGSTAPVYDTKYFTFNYNYGNQQQFAGVNLKIDAPAGGQTPTAPATINWAHNDSTVVTWSFTKFANNNPEYTNITQAPVFVYTPFDKDKVTVVTPTAGTVNITNGKLISLYMTNGGVYKEYGRNFEPTGNIYPTQTSSPVFKFFEELSFEDIAKHGVVKEDTTYQTAKAIASVILHKGKVKIAFNMETAGGRKGVGYTAVPNVEFKFTTPHTTDTLLTQNNLNVKLTGGGISIDTLVLAKYTTIAQITGIVNPIISTSKYNGTWQLEGYYAPLVTSPSITYKVDLLNSFKIADGGLGYTTAPKVRVQNSALKQGTTGPWVLQTIAEAATTIDAQGRIISVADPVMIDNFMIQYTWSGGPGYVPSSSYQVTVPVNVAGTVQAYARAFVDQFGTITSVLLYNEDITGSEWFTNAYAGSNYFSGKGYVSIPKIKVTPVGKTSVTIPAVLQAVVNSAGRISNIIIVNGGKGYDVKNDPNAIGYPNYLNNYIYTNGVSDIQYDIDMGSGYRGDPIDIFGYYY